MVKAKLKGINTVRKTLADGSIRKYYYHRTTGKQLPGKPGEPEFIAAYAAANAAFVQHHTGTLNKLIHQWTLSPRWTDAAPPQGKGYAESTKKEWRRILKSVEAKFGSMPIGALEDPRVLQDFLKWRMKVATENGTREADNRLSVVSSLLTWAKEEAGELQANHLAGFKRIHSSDRSDKIWLPEHIDAFMRAAPVQMQRALILALHTGQRQGDLLRLSWSNYDGKFITLRQGKSGFKRQVEIPCTEALKRMLDGMDRTSPMILTASRGMPWKKRNFAKRWEEVCTKAEIEDLHFHDLRGTAITMLSEAKCTPQMIATITGHKLKSVEEILDKYLKRTRHLAEAAITLFQNAKATAFANRLQTGPQKGQKRMAK
jgi:integrase